MDEDRIVTDQDKEQAADFKARANKAFSGELGALRQGPAALPCTSASDDVCFGRVHQSGSFGAISCGAFAL